MSSSNLITTSYTRFLLLMDRSRRKTAEIFEDRVLFPTNSMFVDVHGVFLVADEVSDAFDWS